MFSAINVVFCIFMFDVGGFRTLMSSESLYIVHVCETALLASHKIRANSVSARLLVKNAPSAHVSLKNPRGKVDVIF